MPISTFGNPDRPYGGRPGAADQSMLLRALKLQTLQKAMVATAGKNMVNTHLHANSPINRALYKPNQLAIRRSIFYDRV